MTAPRLSVVMPVRDAGPYLDASMESILGQSFGDFEFVIRDDGSVDGSTDRLRDWAKRDRRIRLHIGEGPLGPAESSNFVVRHSRAPIVARMDADDLSHPERLGRQFAALEGESAAVLIGTLWEGIDRRGRKVRPRDRSRLVRPGPFAPFPHGSIMFRRDAFERAGGYRRESNFWEDADLYMRMAAIGKLLVLPEALYLHRASALSTRLTSSSEQVERAVERMYKTLELGEEAPLAATGKILPKVFVSLGSTRLWAGSSPAVLGPLWRRADLRPDFRSLAILAWAMWGAASPRSLRFALRTLIRLRDRWVRDRVVGGEPVEWRPVLAAPAAASGDASAAAGRTGANAV
jgi:GT2 family glycosyltransferase